MPPDAGERARLKGRSAYEIAKGIEPRKFAERKRGLEECGENEEDFDETEGRRKRALTKHKQWWEKKEAEIKSGDEVLEGEE